MKTRITLAGLVMAGVVLVNFSAARAATLVGLWRFDTIPTIEHASKRSSMLT